MGNIFRRLIIVVIIFAGSNSYAQNKPTHKELKKFKRGTFEYMDGVERGIIIKRTRRRQYEYDPGIKNAAKLVLKVKWVSDDEFWLTFLSDDPNSKTPLKGVVITVKIISVTKNTYTCHWDCAKLGNGQNSSFRKIK